LEDPFRHAAVAEGIFEPEEVELVARSADANRIRKRAQRAVGIQHESHAVTDAPAHRLDGCDRLLGRGVEPWMDLVGAKAELVALFREVGERLRTVETACFPVTDVTAGIAG